MSSAPLRREIAPAKRCASFAVRVSSKAHDWRTPAWLFQHLDAEFGFTLDAAATDESALCPHYYTAARDNALWQPWTGVVWLNPPFDDLDRFMAKAYQASQASQAGATVVCLVPVRADVGWWHDYALQGEIRFIRGRLRFSEATGPAPFPVALVIFRPGADSRAPAGLHDAISTHDRQTPYTTTSEGEHDEPAERRPDLR